MTDQVSPPKPKLQCNQDILPYKNRLQEFTQRARIQIPMYQVINEGESHAPRFRSTVVVDGNTYKSSNTFSSRRAAEQDAAKVALEGISGKINDWVSNKMSDEGFPSIYEFQEKAFCKLILHEFAAKMNLDRPKYETTSIEGAFPGFVSSVIFGGVKHTGEPCKSKKEAEQNAAREVIVSILGNLGLGTILPEIIKSKAQRFPSVSRRSCSDVRVDRGNGIQANIANNLIQNAASEPTGDGDANKAENHTENDMPIPLNEQISNLQPLHVQPNLNIFNSNQKRTSKSKKKKKNKKLKTEVVAASCNSVQEVSEGVTSSMDF